jgi:hypothetical protein
MANIVTTPEMTKLKIVTTITVREEKELEFDLPYFCKRIGTGTAYTIYKVESEDKVVHVYNGYGLHQIIRGPLHLYQNEILSECVPCTEADFEAAIDLAADKIYEPVPEPVVETNEPDPNVEIDEILERRTA